MCDPTGISETAIAAGALDAGIAGSGAAALSAATAAGPALFSGAVGAGGLFGTGVSGATALSIGATGLSTGLSIMSRMATQSQNAGLYIQGAMNQNRALAQTYNGLNLQQNSIADKTATGNFDILRGLAQAKGKATAAAGEAGVGGVSFSDVLADTDMRAGIAEGTNNLNYQTGVQQSQSQKDAAHASTVANISGYQVPSPIGYFARIGADAINGGLKIFDAGQKGGLWAQPDPSTTPTGTTT
jgi:hypothetical protein